MKIAHRLPGFVIAGLLCAMTAHAQADTGVRVELQIGEGVEYITGSIDGFASRTLETSGVVVSWASSIHALRFIVGADAEWHGSDNISTGCLEPASPKYSCPAVHGIPPLMGGQGLVGARYSLTPRLSVGTAIGIGYLSVPGWTSESTAPSGAYVRSIQGTVEFAATDHVTVVGRGAQYEMPDFGGVYLRARPVSLMMRFR